MISTLESFKKSMNAFRGGLGFPSCSHLATFFFFSCFFYLSGGFSPFCSLGFDLIFLLFGGLMGYSPGSAWTTLASLSRNFAYSRFYSHCYFCSECLWWLLDADYASTRLASRRQILWISSNVSARILLSFANYIFLYLLARDEMYPIAS